MPALDENSWITREAVELCPGAEASRIPRIYERIRDQFLKETGAWTDSDTFLADVEGNIHLDFSHLNAKVTHIVGVWDENNRVVPHIDQRVNPLSSQRGYQNIAYPDVIKITPNQYPLSPSGREFTVRAALVFDVDTTNSAQNMPDWLFTRYRDGLRSGVVADLMMEPNKEYTNLIIGGNHLRRYQRAISMAREEGRRGFGLTHEAPRIIPGNFEV